jgi:hypothetical protein
MLYLPLFVHQRGPGSLSDSLIPSLYSIARLHREVPALETIYGDYKCIMIGHGRRCCRCCEFASHELPVNFCKSKATAMTRFWAGVPLSSWSMFADTGKKETSKQLVLFVVKRDWTGVICSQNLRGFVSTH